MKYFDVFEHPVRGVKAIKHGFSWPAFFFGIFWALFHRLWLPALLLFALGFAAETIAGMVHSPLDSTLEWTLLVLAIGTFAGINGNHWRRVNVSKRGFTYIGTEQVNTPDAAIAAVIRKRHNNTKRT